MFQIFVRAFDLDERLVGVYVTSLQVLKNLLLIGDVVKSVWLVAFQEDPYNLVILAKDMRRTYATNVNFFIANGELSIVLNDEEGVLRLLNPDSRGGYYLLCRAEFRCHEERRASRATARRMTEDNEIPQAKLITGTPSLDSNYPRTETHTFVLSFQQASQTACCLNPRAYRIVRNDAEFKPICPNSLSRIEVTDMDEPNIVKSQDLTGR
ncbi:CPSF A subunit region-domain-containing protein [Chiua virens]|nr:CPSF A subunit region-domain-containing protein [Chiua virens]